jgi:N-acetyltransferase
MIPLDEVLEALELPRAGPGIGYLRSLFARFNERIPFETASKIARHADVSDPREKPRRPDVFWADHFARGTGGTCFARVAAFDALASRLGFEARVALGRVLTDFDHAALLVTASGEDWICDVGFPLPALLPCREGEAESALGALRVTRTTGGWRVEMLEGVPEGPRSLEIFAAPVDSGDFDRHWESTFRAESKFLNAVSLRAERSGRTISFAAGEVRVDDLHSRTRIPLPRPRAPILEEQFGVDRDLLERAFSLTSDPDPAIADAEIRVYLETEGAPARAFAAIASPEGYGRLMSGAAHATPMDTTGAGFRVRLSPREGQGDAGVVEEEITPRPEDFAVAVKRASQETFYEAVTRGARTFLVRRAVLSGPRLDLLRNDSLRGRFAGTLAVDLLAWGRLVERERGTG